MNLKIFLIVTMDGVAEDSPRIFSKFEFADEVLPAIYEQPQYEHL